MYDVSIFHVYSCCKKPNSTLTDRALDDDDGILMSKHVGLSVVLDEGNKQFFMLESDRFMHGELLNLFRFSSLSSWQKF
jgi:hypothetical protein